jgi:hypothetical protein
VPVWVQRPATSWSAAGTRTQAHDNLVGIHPAPDLVRDDAKKIKKMEAIDVILVDRKDSPIVTLSFAKPAGLMMPQRRGQQLGYRMRGADGCALHRRSGDLLPLFRRHSSLFSVHR